MSQLTNLLISASAGTGKTYQLSQRFLALLVLTQGKRPESLIAITFTRKAAGEFKDRILTELANGALDDKGAEKLKESLWEQIKGTPKTPGLFPEATPEWKKNNLNRATFTRLLKILTQNLARLNLCTIDSLFSQIASSCTYDLGISGFKMISDTEENMAKKEALQAMYAESAKDKELIAEFEEIFLSSANSESEASNVDDSMVKRLQKYYDLYLSAPDEELWGNPAALGLSEEELHSPIEEEEFDELLYQLISKAKNEPIPPKKREADKLKQFIRLLNAFTDYTATGITNFHDTENKKSIAQWQSEFEKYWSPEMDALIQFWRAKEIKTAMKRTHATYRMMANFEKKYAELIRNRGRFLFNDVTRLLGKDGLPEQLRQDLEYRMFCRYDHWMLDEFQDTSQTQWQVIYPFLKDLVESKSAEEGSVFVVGDLKQSVYQWRGGDPQLFLSVADQLNLKKRGMATSYRSVQPVLDLVNDVCDYNQTASDYESHALTQWGTYPEHRCAPHLTEIKGTAQIWQTPEDDTLKNDDQVCQAIADILNRTGALQRNLSVAVLVSTNKQALKIRSGLIDNGIPAEVCDDVPVGIDSPLGKDLLYFFRRLLTPADPVSDACLKHSPLYALIAPESPLHLSWSNWNIMLEKEGYSAVMNEIARRLKLSGAKLTPFQTDRLQVWLNEAEQTDEPGMPLNVWVQHMSELKRREDPAGNVARIMTIHKSKGLGFDIVILPQIGKSPSFANTKHLNYFIKKDKNGNTAGIIIKPDKKIYEESETLNSLYHSWASQEDFDGFCKLYVALTRAKKATYVIYPFVKSSNTHSLWNILRAVAGDIARGEPLPTSKAVCLYSKGEPEWYLEHELKESGAAPAPQKSAPAFPALKPLFRKRVSPSGIHRMAEEKADDSPQSAQNTESGRAAAEFGTQVHAVFERLTRRDDADKPAWELSPATDAERTVAECLQCPDIKALFSPPADTVIMKEQRIEAIDGDKWVSGIIDRLHLNGDHATIIDFKTDRTDSPDTLRARHAEQLNAYAAIVARITGIKPENIACVLVSTHMKRVIPV